MIYQRLLWSWQWPRENLFFVCITGVFPTGCWCCGIYALIYFLSFTGISLGSHPRAGVLLRLPHWALLAARWCRQAALQRDAQRQLCCRGEVLPGLPDAGARYSSSPAMPGLDPLLWERAPPHPFCLSLLQQVGAIQFTAVLPSMTNITTGI